MQVTSRPRDPYQFRDYPVRMGNGMDHVAAYREIEALVWELETEHVAVFKRESSCQAGKPRSSQLQVFVDDVDAEYLRPGKMLGQSRGRLTGAAAGIEYARFGRKTVRERIVPGARWPALAHPGCAPSTRRPSAWPVGSNPSQDALNMGAASIGNYCRHARRSTSATGVAGVRSRNRKTRINRQSGAHMNFRKLSSVLPSMFAGLALLSCSANPPVSTTGGLDCGRPKLAS